LFAHFAIGKFCFGKNHGCQMVYFLTKVTNLGKFWRVLQSLEHVCIVYVIVAYFTAICQALWTFSTFPGYLVHFSPFWYVTARKIWQPCNEHKKQPIAKTVIIQICRVIVTKGFLSR
jgi:hypothetical protein